MSKDILVAGCSTSDDKRSSWEDPAGTFWHHHFDKKYGGEYNVTNISYAGVDNKYIQTTCLNALINQKFDLVVVQWTTIGRLTMYNQFNTPVRFSIREGGVNKNVSHNQFHKIWITEFCNFFMLAMDQLLNMILMAQTLNAMGQPYIFMNPGKNFLHDMGIASWKNTSDLYKSRVLHVDQSPDHTIDERHQQLHKIFLHMKSICGDKFIWIDLPSIDFIDFAPDHLHAGALTHLEWYKEMSAFAKKLGYL